MAEKKAKQLGRRAVPIPKGAKTGRIACRFDEVLAIKDLKRHPKNKNKHGKQQVEQYALIMRENYVRQPVRVSNQSHFVTKGHGHLLAAALNGWTHVPVEFQDYESADHELADVVADNALALQADLDIGAVNQEVPELDPGFNIDLFGIAGFTVDPSERLPALPNGDRSPLEQITFTLHSTQAATVRRALKAAGKLGPYSERLNENSNGNALARACEYFLKNVRATDEQTDS